jgi:23S rRNA pseudouridine2605 synthase
MPERRPPQAARKTQPSPTAPGKTAPRKAAPRAAAPDAIEREDAAQEQEVAGERLQKIIAAAGLASRRKAEELILAGRVQINGKIVTELGTKADPARDHIRVDGKLLHGPERPRYFMLNKPKGYVTTASDPQGRHTVMEFFQGGERVYPVGRLDYASEGLLLMTNDGELANLLTRASSHVEKVYLVKISGRPPAAALDQLRAGIMIDRGQPGEGRVMTAPVQIRSVRDADNPWFELTLIEGRNREIRKMFEEVGHFVEKIRRVGYGSLVLDVEPGVVRELSPEEVDQLRRAVQPRKRRSPAPSLSPSRSQSRSRSQSNDAPRRAPANSARKSGVSARPARKTTRGSSARPQGRAGNRSGNRGGKTR